MNKFTVDYDKKTVELTFNEEKFTFDLNEGDVGDFWHSFQDKNNVSWDVNFSQESKREQPCFSVYGLLPDKENPEQLLININDQTSIEFDGQFGEPDNYFGVEEKADNKDLVKRVIISRGWGKERAERLMQEHIDIYEVNEDELENGELSPREVAEKIIEAEMQGN